MVCFVGQNSGFPNFVLYRAGVPNIDNSSAPGVTLKTLGCTESNELWGCTIVHDYVQNMFLAKQVYHGAFRPPPGLEPMTFGAKGTHSTNVLCKAAETPGGNLSPPDPS